MPAKRSFGNGLPLGLAAFLLLALAGPGCAETIRGQVLDARTGEPIAEAVVLGVWTKVAGLPGLTHHELVGVKEAETNGQGHFALERPGGYGIEESVTVYKFGYIAWNNLFTFPATGSGRRKDTQVPPQIRLKAFPAGGDHQKHLSFISDATASTLSYKANKPKFDKAVERERRLR